MLSTFKLQVAKMFLCLHLQKGKSAIVTLEFTWVTQHKAAEAPIQKYFYKTSHLNPLIIILEILKYMYVSFLLIICLEFKIIF